MTERILTDAELDAIQSSIGAVYRLGSAPVFEDPEKMRRLCDALRECRAVIRELGGDAEMLKAVAQGGKPNVEYSPTIRRDKAIRALHALGIDPEQVPSTDSGQGGGSTL